MVIELLVKILIGKLGIGIILIDNVKVIIKILVLVNFG